MKHRLGLKNKGVNIRTSVMVGSFNEPNVPECKPTQVWKVRLVKIQMTGRYEIEIQFRTRLGKIDSLRIDAGSRSDSDRIRRELELAQRASALRQEGRASVHGKLDPAGTSNRVHRLCIAGFL